MELLLLPALFACSGTGALVSCIAGLFGSAAQRSTGSAWLLFAGCGVLQVALSYLFCTPLERRWPLLRWPVRQPMATDIVYTFFVRIVLFPLAAYFEYGLVKALVERWLLAHQWPVPVLLTRITDATGMPLAGFLIGFVILDCADYWRHRISHRFGWWYGLHTLHHAELQMTFWSDDRSHLLEDTITYVWLFVVAIAIGMPALQFPFVILGFRFVGSFAHANTRARYGWLGKRLLISPQFHRAHHCPEIARRKSCNFGTVFPWWDMLFGTANFTHGARETGDPSADPIIATGNWWQQHAAGVRRAIQSQVHRTIRCPALCRLRMPLLKASLPPRPSR